MRRAGLDVAAVVMAFVVPSIAPRAAGAQQPDGARIYAATCQACHQMTGLGLPSQFPPLVGSEWVLGNEDRLVMIVLHGLVGEIEVKGEAFNGAMPALGRTFTDPEIAAVASYVRRSWGNKAAPISVATVTRVRLAQAARTRPWTVAELQRAAAGKP